MKELSVPTLRFVGKVAPWLLLVLGIIAYDWISSPIPVPGITGGTLIANQANGRAIQYEIAGVADQSGLIYVTTTGEYFGLDGSQSFEVTYPTGRQKIFGHSPKP
jgi:hypothetical protein